MGTYGHVDFSGMRYELIEDAYLTDSLFRGSTMDSWEDGTYQLEYAARAIGPDDEEYRVTWRFEHGPGGCDGEEPPEDGSWYDWDDAWGVELI